MTTNKYRETHILSVFVTIEQICNSTSNSNKSVDKRLLSMPAFWRAQVCNLQIHAQEKKGTLGNFC